MSTAPSEAHRKLAKDIRFGLMVHSTDEAAQLIADSEARAAEAANKRLGAQMNYVVALQRAIEHHAQGLEIPAAIGSDCPHHASMLNYALTASRERVRVLEEALGRIEDAADKHSFGGDMLAWAGDVATAALATPANPPAANDEKEGA